MGRERRRLPLPRLSEVQMTSLMDLSFLLLITFIITYPVLEQGINVKLPRGTADAIENLKSQTVDVDAQGGVFLNNRRISLEALENELTALIGQDPQTAVLVRGDERIDYGQIVQVLRVLHKAGVTRMALVTEPE
ncbi:MAG: ExbD/TolR family protein [Kiritimatiellia bacterium]|jgi:biopolymer transport protein ExbD